jgi:glycine betaine/choline ABC-type transport system substrate-binding protein
MRLMNFQVDARGLGAREVARSFLESQGLELNSK